MKTALGRTVRRGAASGLPHGGLGAAVLAAAVAACSTDAGPVNPPPPPPSLPERPFQMGFAPNLPRPDIELFFQVVDSMSRVSDVTIIQQPVPWPELLAGAPFDSLVEDRGGVADFLRLHGLEIVFLVDPLDGLDRRREDPGLLEAGRSILEPEIRQIHEDWVRAIATRVEPEWFGLASEINTLAARGDPALYAEIRDLVNALAPQVRARAPGTKVFVSFQADEANGEFGLPPFDHFGLIDDYDIDALGLSSYPPAQARLRRVARDVRAAAGALTALPSRGSGARSIREVGLVTALPSLRSRSR